MSWIWRLRHFHLHNHAIQFVVSICAKYQAYIWIQGNLGGFVWYAFLERLIAVTKVHTYLLWLSSIYKSRTACSILSISCTYVIFGNCKNRLNVIFSQLTSYSDLIQCNLWFYNVMLKSSNIFVHFYTL